MIIVFIVDRYRAAIIYMYKLLWIGCLIGTKLFIIYVDRASRRHGTWTLVCPLQVMASWENIRPIACVYILTDDKKD